MTQLVQSLLERLAQLPEPVQHRLAKRFLKELEEAEAQTEPQPRKRIAGLGQGGYPRKAGQFGVGQVLYGTEFSHEFSHSTEDRPPWDFGRKAVCFSTFFTTTPR